MVQALPCSYSVTCTCLLSWFGLRCRFARLRRLGRWLSWLSRLRCRCRDIDGSRHFHLMRHRHLYYLRRCLNHLRSWLHFSRLWLAQLIEQAVLRFLLQEPTLRIMIRLRKEKCSDGDSHYD